jgi:hypothetical protein
MELLALVVLAAILVLVGSALTGLAIFFHKEFHKEE